MKRTAVFFAFTLLCVGLAGAQGTLGGLQGTVIDQQGGVLPGVTVTVSSPSLQGTRTAVTDQKGRFRILLLPPGTYRAAFVSQGFQSAVQEEVRIGLEMTITLRVTLQAVFSDEVLVTSQAPALDVTSTTTGTNLGQELIVDLPAGRTYEALSYLAPGAVDGGAGPSGLTGPSILGSSVQENRYVVDELDVTDPRYAGYGTSISLNFVQEVQVKTGGYEAEYGGALGGVVNMITKSGSNEVHGEVFAYYTDDSFAADATVPRDVADVTTGYTEWDVGFDLGGKILTDRLWYFVAYNPSVRDSTKVRYITDLEGDSFSNVFKPKKTTRFYDAKLSWQAGARHSLTATIIGDDTKFEDDPEPTRTRFVQTPYLPTNMLRTWDWTGGPDWAVAYSGILSEDVLLEARYGVSETPRAIVPQAPELPSYHDRTSDGRWTGGVFNAYFGGTGWHVIDAGRERRQLRTALTWFLGDDHELKAGLQRYWLEATDRSQATGPTEAVCVPVTEDFFTDQPDRWEYCDADGDGVSGDGIITGPRAGARYELADSYYWTFNLVQDSDSSTDELSLFLQDAWKLSDYLTLHLGVRADATDVHKGGVRLAAGEGLTDGISLSLDEQIQPRVGVTWDFARNGRSKLYGHYGRFYESIPLDINLRAFGNNQYDYYYYHYPDSGLPSLGQAGLPVNPGTLYYHRAMALGAGADAGLNGSYLEEYIFGAEYEVANNLAVGVKGIYRSLGEVIEDISVDNGWTAFITNPGGCYEVNPVTGEELAEQVCFPQPSRIFRGVELSANKRFADGWQLYASLLWSSNKGNYGGLYNQDTDQFTAHSTVAFDLPHLTRNSYGPMPNDHEWQFKAYGSYHFGFGLVTGGNLSWMSGAPISKLGCDRIYYCGVRFVEPRGSAGRTPDIWKLDLHLAYPFRLGDFDFEVILDVFNVFDQQKAIAVEQFYTLSEDRETDDDPDLLWPWFGEPTRYQSPRNFRVGMRFSW